MNVFKRHNTVGKEELKALRIIDIILTPPSGISERSAMWKHPV
jgi:hypothetical protein